uniref:uncharacterized protein isoform X3 n=1 Tax=Lonchura striata TaxID=40157 RepID=UPI001293F8DC|nr:uncharacterized protein LOC110479596 isoform X3 [Lonchura striata domestica]
MVWGHSVAWRYPTAWGPPQGQCHLRGRVTRLGDIPHSTALARDTHGAHPHTGTATTALGTLSQNCHRTGDTVTELSPGSGHCHRTVTALGTLSPLWGHCPKTVTGLRTLPPPWGHCHRTVTGLRTLPPPWGHCPKTVTGLRTLPPPWGHCHRTVTVLGTLSQNCHRPGDTVPGTVPRLSQNCHRPGEPPGCVLKAQLPPPGWGHQTGNPRTGNNPRCVTSGNCHHGSCHHRNGNCHQWELPPWDWELSPPDRELSPRHRELLARGVTPSWHRHGRGRGHRQDTEGTLLGHRATAGDTRGTPVGHPWDTRTRPQRCHLPRDRTCGWENRAPLAPGGGVTVSQCHGVTVSRCHGVTVSPCPSATRGRCHPLLLPPAATRCPQMPPPCTAPPHLTLH